MTEGLTMESKQKIDAILNDTETRTQRRRNLAVVYRQPDGEVKTG